MRNNLNYIKTEVDCMMCNKSYIPIEKKNHDEGVVEYYANNFCSKECVIEMDKFVKDGK